MAPSSLDKLKRTLRDQDQDLYTPPEGNSPASHDDTTLLSVAFPPSPLSALDWHPVAFFVLATLTPQRHRSNLPPPKPGGVRIESSTCIPPLTRMSSNPQNASIHVGPVTRQGEHHLSMQCSVSLTRPAHTAWNTHLHLPLHQEKRILLHINT
jgi:hypothetical protein